MTEKLSADQASVLAAFEAWIEAVKSDDPQTVADMYAEDAVFWGTVSPYIRNSPEETLHYFKVFKNLEHLQAIYHHPHIRVYGDIAVNSGYYTFFYERNGQIHSIPARYTFVYRREGDEWKIIDHHSSAMPTPRGS